MLELGIVLPADQTWGAVLPSLVQAVFNWTLYRPAVMGARRSLRRVSSHLPRKVYTSVHE